MKAWINADGGSDKIKHEIAGALEEMGWEVHVGATFSNAHYDDYFNVTEDYQIYMTVYNGFCAGTIREAYSPEIQNVLKEKGVTLVVVFDTELWHQRERVAPYFRGDFRGFSVGRAWDDNFSVSDPSIEDVDRFLRENNAFYCAGPDVESIMEQFASGGYFAWSGGTDN